MLKTFSKGGVHPPENKLSATAAIEELPVPETVYILSGQHIGAPAKFIVKKGDTIKTGQLVAESSSFVSANIHSPVSGKVMKIDEVVDMSGYKKPALVVKVEGDEWIDEIDRSKEIKKDCDLSPKEIIDKVAQSGIVGLGGATFPTHIKMQPPKGQKVEVLLVNGVECEPYLTSDHRLMLEKGQEILTGTNILMKGLNINRAIIGIENNKTDAIAHLSELAKEYEGIEIQALKVKYPQGGEKQLIRAIQGREVPSGKLPVYTGCVVQNVGTVFAVYEAVQKNKPLFERVITLTGKNVKKSSNYLVRLGTPVKELIDASGGLPEDTGKVIGGGPMMGKALPNLDVPVNKGTSGILILDKSESTRTPYRDCIRCSKCIHVCPMGLQPYLLMTYSQKELWEDAENDAIMDCIECGSCSYTCPSHRPLLDYIRLGKTTVGKIIRSRKN